MRQETILSKYRAEEILENTPCFSLLNRKNLLVLFRIFPQRLDTLELLDFSAGDPIRIHEVNKVDIGLLNYLK